MWTYGHSMDYHDSTSSLFCQSLLCVLKQNSARIFAVRHKRKWLTNGLPCIIIIRHLRECWNGRQARLRCVWLRRVGSSPISRTKKELIQKDELFFGAMISIPFGHGWYTLAGMIYAVHMIYAARMKGTDIISCLQRKYIMRCNPYIILRQQYFMNCRPFAPGPAGDFRHSVRPSIFHPSFPYPINIPQGAWAPWGRFIQTICSPNWNSSIKFFLIVNKRLIPSYLTITQLCIKSIRSYIPKRCIKFYFPDPSAADLYQFH